MQISIPSDIRGEVVSNYFTSFKKELVFHGNHKRNAYEDILSISQDDDKVKIELSRQGLYDILPEALFHPIDRFDDISSNEYKERFTEEIEQQQIEESNARSYFSLYDKFIFDLSTIVVDFKDKEFNSRVLSDIICDALPEIYKSNRFVCRSMEFIPRCHIIRGNEDLISLMLRKVLSDEGVRIVGKSRFNTYEDINPRYNCQLQNSTDSDELYIGNQYEENVLSYVVQYWNEDSCNELFFEFVDELEVFEDFINDYFMGIETSFHFVLSAQSLPVRLSDDRQYNYLNYNTNL